MNNYVQNWINAVEYLTKANFSFILRGMSILPFFYYFCEKIK